MSPLVLILSLMVGGLESPPPATETTTSIVVLQQQQVSTVYMRRDGVVLRSGTGRNDPVVAQPAMGDPLAVVAQDSLRFQVRTAQGVVGWVAKLNVTDQAPAAASTSGLFASSGDLGPGQRSNVTAIRGLTPEARKAAEDKEVPAETINAFLAVKELSSTITLQQVEDFTREGGIDPL